MWSDNTIGSNQQIVDRYNAAQGLPEGHKAKGWAELGHLTPRQIAELFAPHLPDPLARGRGRPPGTGPVATNKNLIEQLDACVRAGKRPHSAARRLLEQDGVTVKDIKGRADHLVRLWKKSAFK